MLGSQAYQELLTAFIEHVRFTAALAHEGGRLLPYIR